MTVNHKIIKVKLVFFSFLFAISFFKVFGQERINRDKLTFDTTSKILYNAKGWAYNNNLGEWIDYDNVISENKDYKVEYQSLQVPYLMSQTNQSFVKIQTKTITVKGIIYYVLIIDKWSGRYEYPKIREDWYEFKETIGYVFTKSEYQKLFNINGTVELKTNIKISMGSKYEKFDETIFLDLIQNELLNVKKEYLSDYTFPVLKTKEGLIRFYLPDFFTTYSKIDFNKKYFETDFENFNKIILLHTLILNQKK